nr:hypothetical protein [Tanacetum cinerariifolium]GEZ30056.1 hypothetical protein [Tanacetum cinerariifolium]
MDPYGSGTRTGCGFVLGSDGGGDGESCKWQEMEKVGLQRLAGKCVQEQYFECRVDREILFGTFTLLVPVVIEDFQ